MAERADRTSSIQVIARAASILRMLGNHPSGLSLGSIAGQIGLARSTVQRIVQALETEGFVELSGPGGGFQLGPSLSELVYRRQIDIVAEVRPYLEKACTSLGETIALCTMASDSIVAIDRCIPEQTLRVIFPLGTIPYPAHLLAPGRAILAELPSERASALLETSLSKAEATEEIQRLKKHRGQACDEGAFIPDLSAFAVPLSTIHGLYSVATIVPTSRAGNRTAEIFATLQAVRQEIETKVGTMPPKNCPYT